MYTSCPGPKDFCCCHNDNTKTKKQETRMMKIFGRFHLNNISNFPPYVIPRRLPSPRPHLSRSHAHTHGLLHRVRTLLKQSNRGSSVCVFVQYASEVYKHAKWNTLFFPLLLLCVFFAIARIYIIFIYIYNNITTFIEFRRFLNDIFFPRSIEMLPSEKKWSKTNPFHSPQPTKTQPSLVYFFVFRCAILRILYS